MRDFLRVGWRVLENLQQRVNFCEVNHLNSFWMESSILFWLENFSQIHFFRKF